MQRDLIELSKENTLAHLVERKASYVQASALLTFPLVLQVYYVKQHSDASEFNSIIYSIPSVMLTVKWHVLNTTPALFTSVSEGGSVNS